MVQNRIFLADNKDDFIAVATEFLKRHEFEVITATDHSTAHKILLREHRHIQVAVFDTRLVDDSDEHDKSGFDLASMFPMIPSIILTDFTSVPHAVAALRALDGPAIAKDYVDKRDGLAVLLQTIKTILPPPPTLEIYEKLMKHFNHIELRHLCLVLKVDHDNLPDSSKQDKVYELISFLERHGRLPELMRVCRILRPGPFN